MKVGIGLILTHGFPVPIPFLKGMFDWYHAILSGQGNLGLPVDRQVTEARLFYSEDFPVDAARNDVIRVFLDQCDFDFLVFLDCDMRHPSNVIHALVKHGLPVVTGRYQMRKPPFKTVAMRHIGPGPRDFDAVTETSGLVPIDAAGAGCLAIRRDVLEAIRAKFGDEWFAYQVGPKGLRNTSEDMAFFERVKACGFQAVADLDIRCSHVAQFEIDAQWHEPFRKAFDEAHDVAEVAVRVRA